MTYTKSRDNPTAVIGDLKLREFEVDISNYDDDGGGDGEAFAPIDANMRRFAVSPIARVTDGTGLVATYDGTTNSIRLFGEANDGTGTASDNLTEVPSNNNEGATVTITCIGV